jgi:PqqD family protein of HPr-rel-A system
LLIGAIEVGAIEDGAGMSVEETRAPARGSWVATVELDGEAVLFDETSGSLHLLDPVATVIWNRLDGGATVDALAADLSEVFAADRHRVRDDLVTFVRELDHQHLLEGAPVDHDGG